MSSVSCSYQTSTNEIRGKIPIPIPSLIAVKIQLIHVPKGPLSTEIKNLDII
jgi:hypothetical protein